MASRTRLHNIGRCKIFYIFLVAGDKIYLCFSTPVVFKPNNSCLEINFACYMRFYVVYHCRNERQFPSCLSVRSHSSARLSLDRLQWYFILETYEYISKDLNLFKIGEKYQAFYIKQMYLFLLTTTLITIISCCNWSGINYVMLAEGVKYFFPHIMLHHRKFLLFSYG